MFVCSEHPVAERCGNTVAFCFDSALGSFFTSTITFVCVPVSRTKGCLCVDDVCVRSSPQIRKKKKVFFLHVLYNLCTHLSVYE